MPALVPSCCVTLDNLLHLSVPAAGQYEDNQRQEGQTPLRTLISHVCRRSLLEASENSADSLPRG